MNIDIISVLPGMFTALTEHGVVGRALSADNLSEEPNNNIDFRVWNPRDYAEDKHNSVDDRPYGGGPGMVMMAKPLTTTIAAIRVSATFLPKSHSQSRPVVINANQGTLGTAARIQVGSTGVPLNPH